MEKEDLVFGRRLNHPILGSCFYRESTNLQKPQVKPIVLESNMPFIPVYAHFLMYDLEPLPKIQNPLEAYHIKGDSLKEDEQLVPKIGTRNVFTPVRKPATKLKTIAPIRTS